MSSILKNIKKSYFWIIFLKYILIPVYNIFWEYLLNIQGKLLYIFYKITKKNRDYEKLFIKKNDKIVIRSNEKIKDISNQIAKELDNNFLLEMENKLNQQSFPEGHYLHGKKGHVIDMFPFIEQSLQKKILNFALDSMNVSIVSNYLGVMPTIAKINLNLNIPVQNTSERGPGLWHKDDFGFKSLDLFAPIGELGEDNGPFHYLKKKNDLGVFYKITNTKKNSSRGERNKINLDVFEKLNEETNVFKGEPGDGIFIDSFRCYHRGGYCKKNKRIMLRIAYQTPDSTNMIGRENNFSKIINKNNIDIFSRFILFKYPKIFEKLKLQSFLLKIYRFMHYKKELSLN